MSAACWTSTGRCRCEAIEAIGILPRYAGVAVHDCWASYLSYAHCDHALCGAHLLRELTFIVDAHGYAWAKRMKRLLLGACHQVSKRDDKTLTPSEYKALQKRYRTVLCIQDGTDLNFATRPGCEGLSIIGRNQTSAETLGLHLHLTLAVSGAGLPLGVLRCGFDEPAQGEGESEHGAKDNKMQRWLEGLRDVAGAASQLGTRTRVISVMDREADFFELFDEQRQMGGGVDVLVRAKHDRRLGAGRNGPRELDSAVSEIFLGFQAAKSR